jgi:hypothetical protein
VSIARAKVTEGLGLCDAEDVVARGTLTRLLGTIAGSEGDPTESERLMREALRLLEPAGDPRELAFALIMLALRLLEADDPAYESAEVERTFLRALEIARHEGLVIIEARALDGLAALAAREGDDERAHALSTESLAVFRRGDGRGRLFMAHALLRNARLSIARSQTAAARDAILEAFSFFWFAGLTYAMVQALECYAELALHEARPMVAAVLLGSTAAFRGTAGSSGSELRERSTQEAKAMMSPDDFEEAFARGRGLPFEEAMFEATPTLSMHAEVRS